MKFITNYGKSLDDHRAVRWPEKGWSPSDGEAGVNGDEGDMEREDAREIAGVRGSCSGIETKLH